MCWPNPAQFVFHDVASILKSKSRKPFTVEFNSTVVSCGQVISEEFLLFGPQEMVFLSITAVWGGQGVEFLKDNWKLAICRIFGFLKIYFQRGEKKTKIF